MSQFEATTSNASIINLQDVDKWSHPEFVQRIMSTLSMSPEEARLLFLDVKRYLYLCAITRQKLTPPLPIDLGWHEFLMYTRDYQSFCTEVLGVLIHHVPDPVLQSVVNKTSSLATVNLAGEYFGELSRNWSKVSSGECNPDSDCHGDGSCGGDV